ncbi:alpha/beta hydrolase family protein [Halomonas cupida]|uniref:alpha/beta hydrolase family protein n=1 Tax=Halomonas cupida TaxID=44933 RepID=UPI003EF21139
MVESGEPQQAYRTSGSGVAAEADPGRTRQGRVGQQIQIRCKDAVTLVGTYYAARCARATSDDAQQNAPGPRKQGRLPILLCPATGIRQQFYRHFCEWLSQQGRDVLVFDHRGIGESRHGSLVDDTSRLQDWGLYDQPAALDHLLTLTGAERAVMIGHSAGGQMMGLWHNHRRLAAVVSISGSTGYLGGMPLKMRALAAFMFYLYLPFSVRLWGEARTRSLGWGENLPRGVARQWSQWCSSPGYVANALGKTTEVDHHDELTIPITVLHASDDPIATPANVADLLRLFPRASTSADCVTPASLGYTRLGHIDWFRPAKDRAWPRIVEALKALEAFDSLSQDRQSP